MPVNDYSPLTLGGKAVNAAYTWGVLATEARRGQVGWGISIELPAVIEVINSVAEGHATAVEARQALEQLAEHARDKYNQPIPGYDDYAPPGLATGPWGARTDTT